MSQDLRAIINEGPATSPVVGGSCFILTWPDGTPDIERERERERERGREKRERKKEERETETERLIN